MVEVLELNDGTLFVPFMFNYFTSRRGSIVVRAHASRTEGLGFKSDSMP